MTELSPEEEIDHLLQDEIQNNDTESSFFRNSALQNDYIKSLKLSSKLHIQQADRAINLFNSKGHVGLLHLFLTIETIDS